MNFTMPLLFDDLKYASRFCALALLLVVAAGCASVQPRADFLRVVGRTGVALAPQTEEVPGAEGTVQIRFTFAADAQDRVPGILIKPADSSGRRPVVIALHGTGGSKDDMLPLCRELAARGFIAVAIDGRYHGQRKTNPGLYDYNDAIIRAWRGSGEHPFYYDTVWDVMRLVDYLQTREDVDPRRIGLIGISKGGIETYLAAALDPRIAVAVPCLGLQSFHWALAHDDWQGRIGTIQDAFDLIAKNEGVPRPDSAFVKKFYDRVVPGIDAEFDGPQMLRLIAPRPLLVINSDSDNHTPLPGVRECLDAANRAYTGDQDNNFAIIIQEKTGHKVLPKSQAAAIEWFVKWLKP
jgi:dienelactone hydrolase